jgi:uncharacterized protein (TIGR02453 family)
MAETETFTGFPAEALAFFKDLAENNNREWFEAHKRVYLDRVVSPAQQFVVALGERLHELSSDVRYDTRTNGTGSISRIYRDTRFSADKTPYKTHLGMYFGVAGSKRDQGGGYFVHLDVTGGVIYTGVHGFTKPQLEAFRQAVLDETRGASLEAAIAEVTQSGVYTIGGETLKRVPAGYNPYHPRAHLLRYTALYAHSPRIDPEVVTSPQLIDVCYAHCWAMLPLHLWLAPVASGDAASQPA